MLIPTRLVLFVVAGRAVPWSAPYVGRHGAFKDKLLAGWQEIVAYEAGRAYGQRPPYSGAVGISVWIYMKPPNFHRKTCDLTNALKAIEDSLQGTVIVNDRQVMASHNERYLIEEAADEKVFVDVWALPEGTEPIMPGPFGYRPWLYSEE